MLKDCHVPYGVIHNRHGAEMSEFPLDGFNCLPPRPFMEWNDRSTKIFGGKAPCFSPHTSDFACFIDGRVIPVNSLLFCACSALLTLQSHRKRAFLRNWSYDGGEKRVKFPVFFPANREYCRERFAPDYTHRQRPWASGRQARRS